MSLGVNFLIDVRNKQELLSQGWKLSVGLELTDITCEELQNYTSTINISQSREDGPREGLLVPRVYF